jgi:CRP-like cAMP-binding protein
VRRSHDGDLISVVRRATEGQQVRGQRTYHCGGAPIDGPGAFMGELAQLTGPRALVDAHALEPVEALAIPPDRLRALLIMDAEFGEGARIRTWECYCNPTL